MKNSTFLRFVALGIAMWMAQLGAFALDLPVKDVNGRQCYYYTVSNGETVYGVAAKLGLTRSDIIKNNPSAADGLHRGMRLYFPVDEFQKLAQSPAVATSDDYGTYTVAKGETLYGLSHKLDISADVLLALNPEATNGLRAGQVLRIPRKEVPAPVREDQIEHVVTPVNPPVVAVVEETETETDEPEAQVAEQAPRVTVVVMLPFMLNGGEELTKAANQVTEFYRGLMIAADTMAQAAARAEVLVYDTEGSLPRVQHLLKTEPRIASASIIVAPDDAAQLQAIADFAVDNNVQVINNFVVKDSLYLTNPALLLGNIPSQRLQEHAVNAFIEQMRGFTPVILDYTPGRHDKQAFVDALRIALAAEGITPITVEFDGTLASQTLVDQLGTPIPGMRFAFIPTGGSLIEFNKFAPAVARYRQGIDELGGEVRLFGYPEWITFRSDARDYLHKLDTSIYSRFFADADATHTKVFEQDYHRWYGRPMAEGVPSQALLGFDTGCFIFNALNQNLDNEVLDLGKRANWRGLQNSFFFDRGDDGEDRGLENSAAFVVRYLPSQIIEAEVI